jgi:hypothetical protein
MSDVHVLPVGDLVDHDELRSCWCGPRLQGLCPEGCKEGCWRCEEGLVDVDTGHMADVVVVHNAADGRE